MMKIFSFIIILLLINVIAYCQDIPQHISYTRIYDFLDEMANEKLIELNSAIKPYSRKFISEKLIEIQKQEQNLNTRQKDELYFFLEDYALELKKLPDNEIPLFEIKNMRVDFLPPILSNNDSAFRARIQPLLGMNIYKNSKGTITQRWIGVDFQSILGKNLTIYGSLRDITFNGFGNARLSDSTFLTTLPGYQYKEPSDYSDSRAGVKYSWNWGSIGLVKDNVMWGDNYHGSNILSCRVPSFPMITLRIKPTNWFEMNYLHGWLVSNIADSTKYYVENGTKKWYRNHNKFIAANMFTITPYKNLNFSFGNSIIYAENNIQPGYLLPTVFFKSIDHTLTKGIRTENQNSQLFLNISSRNIKHVHLFTSVYVDEFSIERLKTTNSESNPVSLKLGGKVTNLPLENLSITGEFTRSNIIVYKHSIDVLSYASNSYNLGHYLGDNSQEIYLSVGYKPIRGLDLSLYYVNAKHGNEYYYLRQKLFNDPELYKNTISKIISQPFMNDVIWSNQTLEFNALYELYNNIYARVNISSSNIQSYEATSIPILGEKRLTAEQTLNRFTPAFLQGNNTTFTLGLNFGF